MHIKNFKSVSSPSHYSTQKPDPLNAQKQLLPLFLDYRPLSKSINTAHNGSSVLSYYPLPNITHLVARLQKHTIFSLLYQTSGYHHIGLMPEAMARTAFATTSCKWHWNVVPFSISSLFSISCYRWVLLKPNCLGAWKSVWLISNPAYLNEIIQGKGKILAKNPG